MEVEITIRYLGGGTMKFSVTTDAPYVREHIEAGDLMQRIIEAIDEWPPQEESNAKK